jgi:CHAT domain-containing protein
MPTTQSHILRFRQLLPIGMLWALGIIVEPANGADLRGDLSAAAAAYYQGRVDYAIKTLRPLADQQTAAPASPEGKQALEYLLDLCVGGLDFRCITEYTPKYEALVQSLTGVPDALKLPFAMQPAYYYGFAAWLSGDHSRANALLKQWPENIEVPWVPRDYIRRQLIRARLHLMLDERDTARVCVDRALMSIASIDNPGSSLMELSAWFVEAIEDLLALGDTERAIGLSLTNAAVGQKVFPPQSIEYFRLLRVSSEVYVAAGLIPQAKDASERALEVLSHLELDPRIQSYLAADAYTAGSLICAFANDLDCAKRRLNEHPVHAQMPAIRARGFLQTFQEVTYLATRALVDAAPGGITVAEDIALLAKPMSPKIQLPDEYADAAKLYIRCGHALALMRSNPEAASAEMRSLSPDLLRLESKRTDALGLLPKRSMVDQLLLSLAVNAYRGDSLEADAGDMVVRLLDLAARNGQSYASEALSFMSVARTDETRNDLRELLRLRSRRDSAERVDVARMLSAKLNVDPNGNVVNPNASFQRRAIYSDYDSLISNLLARLHADQPDLSAADTPPSLEQIQGSLRDDEVVIGAPPLIGGLMGHLCIRRTMIRFVTSTEDLPSLWRDIRILEAALSSQNQPSEEVDRQYPIAAARRLYDTFLKPAEGCFQPGDAVVWVGAGPDSVPLAALLTGGTTAELRSKRLAEWPWFVLEASVSQVSTLSTLVALRRGRHTDGEDGVADFLGVGDPKFSGLPDSAGEVAQVALRGAVGIGSISALPELPDTRAEVSGAAALFPGHQTLLLGDQATEGDLRRLPLERYAYLEFATHGLVRQDISGLTEPALALTPVSTIDSFDDGLLTASEIADLPLHARFVALSACNTGLLDTAKFASEVPGLAAAFEIAGVTATLGTLWPVESDASRQIVPETFRRIVSAQVGPAVALADSQRQYLQHPPSIAHEHPRFWAPFVIFGDGDSTLEGEHRLVAGSNWFGSIAYRLRRRGVFIV